MKEVDLIFIEVGDTYGPEEDKNHLVSNIYFAHLANEIVSKLSHFQTPSLKPRSSTHSLKIRMTTDYCNKSEEK